MGQGVRWPLWAVLAFLVAVIVFIAWAAMGSTRSGVDNAISMSNDSGITLAVSIDGTRIGPIEPGFRAVIMSGGLRGSAPNITIATPGGTQLADWPAQGEHMFDLGTCGEVTLWVGSVSPSFPPGTDSSPALFTDCPK